MIRTVLTRVKIMEIYRDKSKKIEPLCRFGPGGDFVSVWPKERTVPGRDEQKNLSNVLINISDIVNKLLCFKRERISYAIDTNGTTPAPDAETTAVTQSSSEFQGQQMLLSNDWRISVRVGHKPKHHIRTHRRTTKKGVVDIFAGQGSLFATDLQSARTA